MQANFFEGKRSLRLLTHHQPGGWSPALEKGGYMIVRRVNALVHKQSAEAPGGYPPFARAGVSMRSMGGGLAASAASSFMARWGASGFLRPLTIDN